jgi:hypothetical protein
MAQSEVEHVGADNERCGGADSEYLDRWAWVEPVNEHQGRESAEEEQQGAGVPVHGAIRVPEADDAEPEGEQGERDFQSRANDPTSHQREKRQEER